MIKYNFCIFILTHGRSQNQITLKTIKNCGYTGKWYLVIDNEDKDADNYYKTYGKDKVLMFDKEAISKTFDTCDLSNAKRNAIVYARNVCFELAKKVGVEYFLELDDDYIEFRQRYEKNGTLSSRFVLDFDSIINETLDFYIKSNALTIAWSQMGDFIGGLGCSMFKNRVSRKCMNSFFCSVNRPFNFIGRINEDVNTYVKNAQLGKLMLTVADISLNQVDTQQGEGGMTNIYIDNGTYIKSFYSVITNPSCVKIGTIGVFHIRFHHCVDWEKCTTKIISSRYKK